MAITTRRSFIAKASLGVAGVGLLNYAGAFPSGSTTGLPVVVSTWKHGVAANKAAWDVLSQGGYALDAVEAGIRVPEADPEVISVGYGGVPDASGKVTLDAAVMDESGNAGSVAYLSCIKHPVSVARLVMEKTPHVMLAGKGAQKFALGHGFEKEKLLTPEMKKLWKRWKNGDIEIDTAASIEEQLGQNHDTIGMLALDEKGRICGGTSTSGIAFKLHGRVGDAPLIGAGLYIDGETGGAVVTGSGEIIIKTMGAFLVVELMRNGMNARDACMEAVKRIVKKSADYENYQVGFLALDKNGNYGAFSILPGFDFAVKSTGTEKIAEADSWMKTL